MLDECIVATLDLIICGSDDGLRGVRYSVIAHGKSDARVREEHKTTRVMGRHDLQKKDRTSVE